MVHIILYSNLVRTMPVANDYLLKQVQKTMLNSNKLRALSLYEYYAMD